MGNVRFGGQYRVATSRLLVGQQIQVCPELQFNEQLQTDFGGRPFLIFTFLEEFLVLKTLVYL